MENMIEVSDERFYRSFERLNVSSGCPSTHKVWEVRLKQNNELIAVAIEDESGKEKFYIKKP